MTVSENNDRKALDSAGFTKASEVITGKPQMTTGKPHRFGQKQADSRFYPECDFDTTGICSGALQESIDSRISRTGLVYD